MAVNGIISLFWPPMHLRGAGFTLTDTLHIVWATATVLLMMLAIGFGAAAFGKLFRLYSIATMVILVACGVLTFSDGPRIAVNLPTPWVGVWERINIGVFLVWIVVLAATLLRAQDASAFTRRDDTFARLTAKGGQVRLSFGGRLEPRSKEEI